MSRPLRIEYPDAWYHVMNRGANRLKTFKESEDYDMFLRVIEEACTLFNVSLSAYCLMNNHYHLLIRTPEGNISRFMRHVNGVYTQRFNRKYKRDGSLFRGRFKAILIQADEYLTQVVKYIHNNPVKARVVNAREKYKWSSHLAYLKGKSPKEWLELMPVLSLFSLKRKLAIVHYKEFMGHPVKDEVTQFYSKKNQTSILGEATFKEWIKANFIKKDDKAQLEIKEKRELQGEKILTVIKYEVCRMFKVNEEMLFERKRGEENLPKFITIALSRELSGLSLAEIAETFKMSSYKTVGTTCFRLKKKMEENKTIKKKYKRLKFLCSQGKI